MVPESAEYMERIHALQAAKDLVGNDDGASLCAEARTIAKLARRKDDESAELLKGEAALVLHRVLRARTGMPTLARNVLETLCEMGPFGRMLAGRHVRSGSISATELAGMLGSLSISTRMDIADEMLAEGVEEMPRGARETADMLVGSIRKDEAGEVAEWLAQLGSIGRVVSHPLAMSVGRLALSAQQPPERKAQTILGLGGQGSDQQAQQTLQDSLKDETPDTKLLEAADRILPASHPYRKQLTQAGIKAGGASGRMATLMLATSALPGNGKVLARLHAGGRGMDACRAAVMLSPEELGAFFKALSGKDRATAISEAFTAAAEAIPFELSRALAFESSRTPEQVAQLTPFVDKLREQAKPSLHSPGRCRTEVPERKGLFDRVFREGKHRKLERLFEGAKSRESDIPMQVLQGRTVSKYHGKACTAPDSTILKCSFENSNFTDWSLKGTHFSGCRFSNCSFVRVSLREARFCNCSFNNCTFEDCDLSGASMHRTAFAHCTLTACNMQRIAAVGFSLSGCHVRETSLGATHFRKSRFSGNSFRYNTFARAIFAECTSTGSEHVGSSFANADIHETAFINPSFHDCIGGGLTVDGSDTPHSFLLEAYINTVKGRIRRGSTRPPQAIRCPEGCAVAARALIRLSRHLQFSRREELLLANNERRLASAFRKMLPDQRDFLNILPELLQSDVFERIIGDIPAAPFRVWGHAPTLSTTTTVESAVGRTDSEPGKAQGVISALYAMGSMGSVAQTTSSDLDCWLVVESQSTTREALKRLELKCRSLEAWAWDEFSLETHFFIMSEKDVRENRFGLSDSESSGSAQAILLKEEFYRTALRLSGKNPVWWLTDPGLTDARYAATVPHATAHPLGGTPRMTDMGHLRQIPPGEFFGAALWQMIKAIHSPFKSVMKLGLLERYSTHSERLSLADLIKQRLFDGAAGSGRVDPYAAMYLELKELYGERGDNGATRLITESFLLKADLSTLPYFRNLPATPEAHSLVELLFGNGYVAPEVVTCDNAPWTFSQSLEAGNAVSDFMTTAYRRIHSMINRTGDTASLITPEDLTRLGRRIMANFARKPNKIPRIPFIDVGLDKFSVLRFEVERRKTGGPLWKVRGAQSQGKTATRDMQELQGHTNPAVLPAWLVANRLFRPGMLIQADRSIAPVATTDLQQLLSRMYDFFPYDDTFEGDLDEGLKTERVVRAFLIVNLGKPLELKHISDLAVIYATNWGEMFCRTFTDPKPTETEYASHFLHNSLEQPPADEIEIETFAPRGSHAPRINTI
jgi:adenylate cyclase class 1